MIESLSHAFHRTGSSHRRVRKSDDPHRDCMISGVPVGSSHAF